MTHRPIPPTPPRLAERLVELCTPPQDRHFVCGDLREEFEQRIAAGQPVNTVRRWYRHQARGTCLHGLRRRLQPRPPTPQAGGTNFMLATALRDIRYAVRSLIREPAYTTTAVLMLVLGIAGNTAVFSVFNGLFLRPLPFSESSQLVNLDQTAPEWNLEFVGMNYQDFVGWRANNSTFEHMAVFDESSVNMSTENEPLRVTAAAVSHDMSSVLRMPTVLGRHFRPEEDVPGGPKVVQLSYGIWQTGFAGDSSIVGQTLTLDGEPYTVVGVLPREAQFLGDAALWLPLAADVNERTGSWWLDGIGRLKPGVTLETAVADLTRIHRAIPDRGSNDITTPVVIPVVDRLLGDYRLGTSTLLGAVALVLLIACANISGLTLARAVTRGREVAIRVSLGAGQRRLVQQLLTESLVLSAVGAILGTGLGIAAASGLRVATADAIPAWISFSFDGRVLAFTVVMTIGAALAFGLAPALRAARAQPGAVLHQNTGRASASRGRHRALDALVVTEVALSLVLLVSAGLAVRDLQMLHRLDPGFQAANVLTYLLDLPSVTYDTRESRLAFFEEHLEQVRTVPGVESAAAVSLTPLSGHSGYFFEVENVSEPDPDAARPVTLAKVATAGYFETMRIPILRGRGFQSADGRSEGAHVVVINETFANRYWPDTDPLGKRIRTGSQSPWLTVVGVAQDVKHYGVDAEMRQAIYWPMPYAIFPGTNIVIRTANDPETVTGPVRQLLATADPELPMANLTTMSRELNESLWPRRAASWLAALFSIVALGLAVGGIYGVVSYTVSQRSREISIRVALGAEPRQVVSRIVRHGTRVVGIGIALGIAGAIASAQLMSGLLVGVEPRDPLVYGSVIGTLLLATVLANFLPARRAAGIPPADVLRDG